MHYLGKEDATEDELILAVQNATPEDFAKIKEAEYTFKLDMKQLDIDLENIHSGDRASARTREEKVGGYANPILAGIVILGFFLTVLHVLTGGLDTMSGTQASLVGTLIGYVSAKADQVVSYYFGSSKGSSDKTKLLAKRGKQND